MSGTALGGAKACKHSGWTHTSLMGQYNNSTRSLLWPQDGYSNKLNDGGCRMPIEMPIVQVKRDTIFH
jgi:hypothetical protein